MVKSFVQRNSPVFIIGGLTVIFFLVIIVLNQTKQHIKPQLKKIDSTDLVAEHTYTRGPDNASVVLVEFASFQCSSCAVYSAILRDLADRHPNTLKIAYRHFPFESQTQAIKAAEAAQVAGAQGKFWEYGEVVFEHQYDLSEDDLVLYAKQIRLDIEKFRADLESGKYASAVEEDIAEAKKLGLDSTPSFFLNGEKLELVYVGDLRKQIEAAIAEVGQK